MKILVRKAVTRLMHRQVARLDRLYQSNVGQECYIFGNGITLKWMDLNCFADRPSILSGALFFHREVRVLDAAYYAITEPLGFYPFIVYRKQGKLRVMRHFNSQEFRKEIICHPETLFFVNVSNYPVTRMPNVIHVSRWYKPPFENKNPFGERDDAHHGTIRFQIALAIYLGFKKAYLVGHDYTHNPSRSLHFFEKGEGIFNGLKDHCRDYIDYAKQHIDLVTVTLDGSSETMSSITYKDLTGKEPVYRENIELVDANNLRCLAKWHGYSIF